MLAGEASSMSARVMPFVVANSIKARCAVLYVAAVLSHMRSEDVALTYELKRPRRALRAGVASGAWRGCGGTKNPTVSMSATVRVGGRDGADGGGLGSSVARAVSTVRRGCS